jgi:hypothetical protein
MRPPRLRTPPSAGIRSSGRFTEAVDDDGCCEIIEIMRAVSADLPFRAEYRTDVLTTAVPATVDTNADG